MAPSKSTPHTFNELALRYVAQNAATMRNAQLNRRLDQLGQYVMGYFGNFDLADITPTRVQKFIYHLEMKGLKPSAIQGCLVSFRACMKYAKDQHWPVSHQLSRPLVLVEDAFMLAGPQLSSTEFTRLYQDLLQDMSKDMFH